MADQTPHNDPLCDRLRSTFAAERADIERRHLASGSPVTSARSWKWIPFAVAAALLAIAGFAFIGNRGTDQAVDLDVAAQPGDRPTPIGVPVPVDPGGTPVPTPDGIPNPSEPIPFLTGMDMCGESYNPGPAVVAGRDGGDAPAIAEPDASDLVDPTRMLAPGTAVELAGGCTRGATSQGLLQWYEISGADGEPNDWILSDYLTWQAQPEDLLDDEAEEDVCGGLRLVPHFVWEVQVTDPDGGLIAHTAAGVDEPVTRVIRFDEVVTPTGTCALASNGALWLELRAPDDASETDWVNAQYVRAAEPTCLQGEQFGTTARGGQPIHIITTGDRLSSIADDYDIEVDEILRSNQQIDPNLIIAGNPILIPGRRVDPLPISGPLEGWAVSDGDSVAFTPTREDTNYLWYSSEGFSVGAPCVDVSSGSDALDERPCMRVAAPVTDSGRTRLEYLRWPAGDQASTADHIHNIRTETNDRCTRVVITFGDNANEEAADGPSALLPPIMVTQDLEFVRITANDWQLESAFGDADRIDYPGGIGLLTLSAGFEFAVELMHREMEPNVRFFADPARVVVDFFPAEFADPASTGPFGERFVLRAPIQVDPTGQGIPVDNTIFVSGFGRPFEAAGLYRIWAVADDVDAEAFLADPPEPLIEEFFATRGSAEAWGRFDIPLPDLEVGSYIAVFGELPPTDEIGFYGTGQLFRVADAPTEEPGNWPEAVLLPDVQLPPE